MPKDTELVDAERAFRASVRGLESACIRGDARAIKAWTDMVDIDREAFVKARDAMKTFSSERMP